MCYVLHSSSGVRPAGAQTAIANALVYPYGTRPNESLVTPDADLGLRRLPSSTLVRHGRSASVSLSDK